jgi:hypothetical protein
MTEALGGRLALESAAAEVITATGCRRHPGWGTEPCRVHIDPEHDGAEEAFTLGDRLRATYLHRLGLSDLLAPAAA